VTGVEGIKWRLGVPADHVKTDGSDEHVIKVPSSRHVIRLQDTLARDFHMVSRLPACDFQR